MIWQSLEMLHLLWLLPGLLCLFAYAAYARKKALARLACKESREWLMALVNPSARSLKHAILALALPLLVLALARPSWTPVPVTVNRSGRDVVFVLDVSRSMLADDLQPNRLERAKLAISDCLEVLDGDRVGLVIFAGNAVVRCPLTVDYGFFRMTMADVEPGSVGRGGTKIGDALRLVASEVLDGQDKQYKDVVLITDGEDQDSFAQQAAEALGKEGVRLFAIGLGNEGTGTPIMVKDDSGARDFIRDNGEIVRSRLDSASLRKMAAATPGGSYLAVGTGNFDLGAIYRSIISSSEKRQLGSETIEKYEEKYQIFLFCAVLLIALEPFVKTRRKL